MKRVDYLEVPMYDWWFLLVHVLHSATCLVEHPQHLVTRQRRRASIHDVDEFAT